MTKVFSNGVYAKEVVQYDENGNIIAPLVPEDIEVTYLGEQVISGNNASQDATLPNGTREVWIGARGGPVYATINGDAAAASSGIYVPENSSRVVPMVGNMTSLGIWAAADDFAHLIYYG